MNSLLKLLTSPGKGSQSYPDGTLYEGDWAGGNRHGHGVLSKNCGHGIQARIYTGMWKEDYPHGFGLRQYGDGSLYKGQFGRGYRHGPGCMYYPDGMIYMGNWVKGQKTGVGRLIRADTKDYYEGNFYKGVKCGMGKYHHLRTGQIQDGVWVDNMARVTLMSDVKARQTAKEKTPFPIPLLYLDEGAHVFAETANAHYENTKACHA